MSKTPTIFTGIEIAPLEPGSPEWLKSFSASKVGAILGLSRYESAYSLWAKMTGLVEDTFTGNKATERGTYLEPALIQWFRDRHPEFRVKPGVSFAHPEQPRFTAAPDAIIFNGRKRKPHSILEAKTAFSSEGWGTEGTSEIPEDYLAQVVWQLYVTGALVCYVVALVNLEIRLYVVTRDEVESEFDYVENRVTSFMELVDAQEPPAWDGHDKTYEVLRTLHPEIDPELQVTADEDFAARLTEANAIYKSMEKDFKAARVEAAGLMGNAKTLVAPDGRVIATRQARGTGKPYVTVKSA